MKREEIEELSATMATVVREHVDAATRPLLERIAALEARQPEKGEAGRDGINGKDGEKGERGADGKDGAAGRDGVSLAGALIDRTGNLVLTLSDGTTRDLGLVIGKDGENGKDGADALGFDDLTEEIADDGRTIIRRYQRGEEVKEFRHTFPVVLDRGVYKAGTAYEAGDGVTWGGSFWIAQEKTAEKPDSGQGWRLAVKRGRDGKNALDASPRPKEPVRVGVPVKAE